MNEADQPAPGIGFREFVVLIAALTALTALSIDIMLPAFPQLDSAFALPRDNDRQAVVTFYLIGFALGQLVYGPISDRFGRRPMIFFGLAMFAAASALAALAESFPLFLAARAAQGVGAAAPRVIAFAIIRDCFGGRAMARVVSLIMMVFISVPVIAPTIGQLLLLPGDWRWIFAFLIAYAAVVFIWALVRLPETLHREYRRSLSPADLRRAALETVTARQTIGYGIAVGFMFGALMAYIGLSQQIFVDTYRLGSWFPLAFGTIALAFAIAAYLNSQLVLRLGMHRLSHGALVAFLAIAAIHLALSYWIDMPLALFAVFLALSMFLFGLIAPNFNAMALEPQARNAGMASSFIGAYSTASSGLFGWLIGQQYDGSVHALTIGFLLLALLTLATVLIVERGHLGAARNRDRA